MRRRLLALAVVLAAAAVGSVAWAAVGGGSDSSGDSGGGEASSVASLPQPPSGKAEPFSPAAAAAAPGPGVAIVALGLRDAVPVYRKPDAQGRPLRTIERRTVDGKRLRVVFLALRRRQGWVNVQLPVRPDGARAWVRRADVELRTNPYRVVVDLQDRRLTAYAHDRRIATTAIGVGQAVSPTPTGRYFITDLLRPPDPHGFYGPYAFGLSAYSPVYTSFAGGDGQVGIHGTNTPSVLGSDVSHGCIRVANALITRLASTLPLGTPVEITRD